MLEERSGKAAQQDLRQDVEPVHVDIAGYLEEGKDGAEEEEEKVTEEVELLSHTILPRDDEITVSLDNPSGLVCTASTGAS